MHSFIPSRAAILVLLLFSFGVRVLEAQTAWTLHPDAPLGLPSNAKLKYSGNAFRLGWQTNSNAPVLISMADLSTVPDVPTPYSLVVNSQSMGVDPAPGFPKKLTIRYATGSGEYVAQVTDGSQLNIPSAGHTLVGPAQSVTGFTVVSATYGTTTISADVRKVFRVKSLSVAASYLDFTLTDFTEDGSGSLLFMSGGYYPAAAFPPGNGNYLVRSINYGSFSSSVKACGVFGNGKLVMGFSDPSSSYYFQNDSLVHASSSNGYSSWAYPYVSPACNIKQIVWEAGKFVAVGSRYDAYSPYAVKGVVLVSPDGVEWTPVVIPGTSSLEAVCRDEEQWVAVGDSGAVLTSPNGYEWTKTTVPGAGTLLSVAHGNGTCAVGSSSGTVYTSTDLTSWSSQLTASGSATCLAVGDGQFMALVGTKVYQSPFSLAGTADIVSQPANAFIVPQQSALLTVGAVGSGSLSYQWYEGVSGNISAPIDGATESSYQTPPLDATASYWVRVSNSIGSEDSMTAALTMQMPPVITAQPAGKTLAMGASDSTSVTVTGNNISYQWYQGFSGDVSNPLAGKTSASLTLPNQLPGVIHYWVRASNARGSVDSTSMRAEVTPFPPAIVDEPVDVLTNATHSKSLHVYAVGPNLTYQWYGGYSGDTSQPVSASSSYFYPPYNLAGNYRFWVRVSNALSFVDSRTVVFTVLDSPAPVITRQPYDTTTYVGSSKSISVAVTGDALRYTWYAGESGTTSVLLSDSSSSFSPSYTVPGIYRYWVRISNESGQVDSTAATYVVKPLATGLITKHPLDATAVVNSSVSLTVTASGSGLSYQWYSGVSGDTFTPLSGKTSTSFSPPVTTPGQQTYWVRVTSGESFEDSEAALVEVIPPILVITAQPLDLFTYVGDSESFNVYTNGLGLTYQWYSGFSGDTSNPITNKTSYSFSPPTTEAGTFHYWMRATSGAEHVDSLTATVTVIGRPPFFTTQPLDKLLTQGTGSVSLSASLDYSTGATWHWYQGERGDTSVPLAGKTSSSMSISNPLAGSYSYWVRATNPYGTADSRTSSVIVTPANYSHWLVQNGLPSDGSGLGAPDVSLYQDGVANLLKFILGMRVTDRFDTMHGPHSGFRNIGGNDYLTLEFVQSLTAQGVALVVEESADLGGWSATPVECGPSYDNGDGTMTRTFRGSQPVTSGNSGYLRLKATAN